MNFYENIEAYLEGSLSASQIKAFEAAMESDKDLRSAVDNYPDAVAIAKGLLEIDVMESISNAASGHEVSTQSESRDWGWPMWVLGALILIGIVLSIRYFIIEEEVKKPKNREALFAQLYQRPIDPEMTKSVDTVNLSLFEKGKYYFNLNDFELSEEFFIEAVEKDAENRSNVQYWLGNIYMIQKDFDKANDLFTLSSHADAQQQIDLIKVLKNNLEEEVFIRQYLK